MCQCRRGQGKQSVFHADNLLFPPGESGTGKSCLLHHFIHNAYKDNSAHTIGVEFSSRIVKVGNKSVKLQLWDTAGQERFRCVSGNDCLTANVRLLISSLSRLAQIRDSQLLSRGQRMSSGVRHHKAVIFRAAG